MAAVHPWRVLAVWLAAAVILGAGAATWGSPASTELKLPGAPSQQVLDQLAERFPEQAGGRATVVFGSRHHRLADDPATQGAIERTLRHIERLDHVRQVIGPIGPAAPVLTSADGRVAWGEILFDVDAPSVPTEVRERLVATGDIGRSAGLEVGFGGPVLEQVQPEGTERGELVGIAVALIVLAVAFGSVVAALLPVGLAAVTVVLGLFGVRLLASTTDVNAAAFTLASMIGVAVGIDYALFIVSRFRQSLDEGHDVPGAVGRSVDTAGRSVLFAGGTVMISVLGLAATGIPVITSMGTSVSLTVAVALLASLTLLPAMLGLIGTNIDRARVPFVRRRGEDDGRSFSTRWATAVTRRPLGAALTSAGVLLLLAVPATRLTTGWPDAGHRQQEDPARVAFDLMAEGFGPGANGPLLVAIDRGDPAHVARVRDWLAGLPEVQAVSPAITNHAGDLALVQVTPASGPEKPATATLVDRIRTGDGLPAKLANAVGVTGATAFYTDLAGVLSDRLPWFIGAVVGLSLVLLTVLFRAPVVALKAAAMNLLGIAAAYGAVVMVFQWGWGLQLLGLDQPTPIFSYLPIVMFAVLFGLSMDYEVFILSRMRESWVRQGDNRTAVVEGLGASSRVVTAAALIMLAVFAGFTSASAMEVKMAGFGLAVAVLLDATLIRQVLVPATMTLLGDRNWWIPAWLDRVLPNLDVEGGGPGGSAIEGEGREARAETGTPEGERVPATVGL